MNPQDNDNKQQPGQHPESLLPWYVNGTLTDAERAAVEAWLAENPEARQELEFLRKIAAREQAEQPQPPGELGFKRLQRQVQRSRAHTSSRHYLWRPLAIAAMLLLIVQTAIVLQPGPVDEFLPATEPVSADLQVTFNPDATEEAIRELLQQIDAEIIGGPGLLGVYRLALTRPVANHDIEKALETLRDHDRVVRHASRS